MLPFQQPIERIGHVFLSFDFKLLLRSIVNVVVAAAVVIDEAINLFPNGGGVHVGCRGTCKYVATVVVVAVVVVVVMSTKKFQSLKLIVHVALRRRYYLFPVCGA
jgi:hypothetical protein